VTLRDPRAQPLQPRAQGVESNRRLRSSPRRVDHTTRRVRRTAGSPRARRRKAARRAAIAPYALSIETAGLLTLLLGAWAGLVPYAAPAFGYSADGTGSWYWDLAHTVLFLVPGGVACLAGLMIMIAGLSHAPSRRAMLGYAGLLTALSGAWLVVGPFTWPVLEGHAFFITGASSTRELIFSVMYSIGTGGLILALGAFVLGRPRPSSTPASPVAEVPDVAASVLDAPVTA
jgi:hypothetical protein